jgi:hypothetical protein
VGRERLLNLPDPCRRVRCSDVIIGDVVAFVNFASIIGDVVAFVNFASIA